MEEFTWSAPNGFAEFTTEGIDAASVDAFIESLGFPAGDLDSRDAVRRQIAVCAGQEAQPASWAILVAEAVPGQRTFVGLAEVAFTDLVDVEKLAARWASALTAESTVQGESRFIAGRRAPAAVLRTIELDTTREPAAYVERGILAKSWARLGVTGVIRVTARNLASFADLAGLLAEASVDFTVEAMDAHV